MPRLFPKLILLCFLALAACESAEERAARHYQSGLALLETGQVDQALIEFRNVFAADPNHIEARLAYADTQRARGALADAYGHYRHLAEQQPENAPALIALSEIAILSADWEDAETYGRAAAALQPADPAVIAVTAMLDYRAGAIAKDDAARAAAAEIAQKVLQDDPANDIARGVVIDNNIFKGDIAVALTNVEAGLAIDPTRQGLHVIRVRLLGGMKDTAGTQAALEEKSVAASAHLQRLEQLQAIVDAASAERATRAQQSANEALHVRSLTGQVETLGGQLARVEGALARSRQDWAASEQHEVSEH